MSEDPDDRERETGSETDGSDSGGDVTDSPGDATEPASEADEFQWAESSDAEPGDRSDEPERERRSDEPERERRSDEDDDDVLGQAYGKRKRSEESRGITLDDTDDDSFWATYGRGTRGEQIPEESLKGTDQAHATLQNISWSDLREHYGLLRTLFKQNEELYTSFRHQLVQAWIPETYEQYLSRVISRAVAIGVLIAALGIVAALGLVGGARYGVVPETLVGRRVGLVASAVAGASVAVGILAGVSYWVWWRIIWIRSRISQRRREINYNLPYAITFMYALARADVSFDRIVLRLANNTETYGAVSQEFERVVRDVEMFGNNLYIGLENLRRVTPSAELRRFTDDVLTVLETGGDLAPFLRDEVDTQLEAAVSEQESFIEQLELLSEVFVVGFVAAPLFVLVVLIVISFLGAQTLVVIGLLVYVAVPLGLAGFAILIDSVSQPFNTPSVSFTSARETAHAVDDDADAPEWWAAYERDKRLSGLRNRIRDQAGRVWNEPWRALVFSGPIALAMPVAGVLRGTIPLGLDALVASPVVVTTELLVAPVVIAAVPVALVYEYQHRLESAFQRRFPDLLELLATSNRRGLSLTRGLDIVSNSTSGRLGEEVQKLRNDILWNADLPGAFEAFGNRLASPALQRTVDLIAEGSRATSDLHIVLEVAATDTAERVRLQRKRRQTLQSYLVIVIIGFLVYLLVVLLLANNFLDPIAKFSETAVTAESGPVSLGAVPVSEIRTVLFHSALIQGFGSGLLAGKLAENSLYSGLKYGIGLTLLAVVAFTVI